jgi:hypothetical protein
MKPTKLIENKFRDYAIWIVVAVVVLIAVALVWFNPGVPVG